MKKKVDDTPALDLKTLKLTLDEVVKAIREISRAMRVISSTKLKYSTIVTLLAQETKLPRRTIIIVLDNLQSLETLLLETE